MNYFELFDLPVAPAVDKTLLAKKYFELQRKSHPDFFTKAGDIEKEDALKQSADINKAFGIFQHPEKTIEYFLQLQGMIAENEKYNLPADFLMEMMEINEALGEEDEAQVKNRVDDFEKMLDNKIEPFIGAYEKDKAKDADLLQLKEYYYKKKYLNRILDRLVD